MASTNLLISIPDFLEIEPFGRTKTYELLNSGELESVYVGRRRMIVAESYRRYVERLKAEASGERRPSPNPKARNHAPGGHLATTRTRAKSAANHQPRVRVDVTPGTPKTIPALAAQNTPPSAMRTIERVQSNAQPRQQYRASSRRASSRRSG